MAAAQTASTLVARMDPRWIAGAGGVFVAAGMFGFSRLQVDSSYGTHLLPFILLLAFGMGLIFVPLTLTAVSGVANEDSGVGSAVLNTVQQIGGAIGLALLGTISASAIKDKFAELAPGLQKAAEAGQSPEQLEQLEEPVHRGRHHARFHPGVPVVDVPGPRVGDHYPDRPVDQAQGPGHRQQRAGAHGLIAPQSEGPASREGEAGLSLS